MTYLAALLSVAAALFGALCASADAALLAGAPPGPQGALGTTGEGSTLPHGDHRDVTHRALSIARITAYLLAGAAGARALGLPDQPLALALPLAIAVTIVVATLAATLPRAIGEEVGRPLLRSLDTLVDGVETVLRPLIALGSKIDAVLRRVLPPARPAETDRTDTAQQLRRAVQADAAPVTDQRTMLRRVFSLGDTEVEAVMVPRVDIVGVETGTPWSEVLERVRSSQHARLPVFEETLDHVIGIVFAKDLLPAVLAGEEPAAGWESLVRPATFIPGTKTIDAQLRDFKATRSHLAIVVDEYGGTAGLVTIEDILEEIVGDIRDEYDREEPAIEHENGSRYWVSGRVTLDELSETVGHRFEHEDVSTVGGLVFQLLGHVPRAGETLTLNGFRVVVERVVRRRVDRVYLERLPVMVERES